MHAFKPGDKINVHMNRKANLHVLNPVTVLDIAWGGRVLWTVKDASGITLVINPFSSTCEGFELCNVSIEKGE